MALSIRTDAIGERRSNLQGTESAKPEIEGMERKGK
jgi:hypothetical protein